MLGVIDHCAHRKRIAGQVRPWHHGVNGSVTSSNTMAKSNYT